MNKDFKGKRRGPGGPRTPRKTFTEEIIELDGEVIRLIAKRAKLLARIRGGKGHAATPRAIKEEKQIRNAWEARVTAISRDSRFSRQLLNLLHDLEVSQSDSDAPLSLYNLAPARMPVEVDIAGPALGTYSLLWATLGLVYGKTMQLKGVWRTQPVADFVKAFNQAGADFNWSAPDTLEFSASSKLDFTEKGIFVGDNLLAFYLISFIGAGTTGRLRFTGGKLVKNHDLTPVYKFMPSLGARLSWVIPGSKSLPATLECSGEIPDMIDVPANLSYEAIVALMLAALVWQRKVVFNFDEADGVAVHNALNMLAPMFAACGDAVDVDGTRASFAPWNSAECNFPTTLETYLAPAWSAALLALPYFSGGRVKLHGKWVDAYSSPLIVSLLRMAGLKIDIQNDFISSYQPDVARPQDAISFENLPNRLHPIFWAINGRIAAKGTAPLALNSYPNGANLELATDFLEQIGVALILNEGKVTLYGAAAREQAVKDAQAQGVEVDVNLQPPTSASKSYGWISPGPAWTLAFSLLAFVKANLKLVNPDSASEAIPRYWQVYNSLPCPKSGAIQEDDEVEAPTRRRIITSAMADLTELVDLESTHE